MAMVRPPQAEVVDGLAEAPVELLTPFERASFRTMEALGRRVAEAALRWREEPLAKAA